MYLKNETQSVPNSIWNTKQIMEEYSFVRKLGTGKYGAVGLFRNKKTNELEAIKMVKHNDKKARSYIRNEILNMLALDSPYIVSLKNLFVYKEHTCLSMEYYSLGDLHTNIIETQDGFPEGLARWYFWQLVHAVKACHDVDIAHRDIKLENILLAPSGTVKLCDFGLSERYEQQASTIVGTPDYLAPEMIAKTPFDTKSTDIWACGITLYIMLYAQYPFSDAKCDTKTLIKNIVANECVFPEKAATDSTDASDASDVSAVSDVSDTPDASDASDASDTPNAPNAPANADISDDAKDLILKLLVKSPENRITLKDVICHPWFANSHFEHPEHLKKDKKTSQPSYKMALDVLSQMCYPIKRSRTSYF